MIKQLPLAFLALFPLPAIAEGYLVTPQQGGGVEAVSVTSVTDWVLSEGLGGLPKAETDRATGVIFEEGKPPRLVFDTLEDIDRRYGGGGTVDLTGEVIHLEDADGNLDQPDIIPLADIPEDVPIELFEDDIPKTITLRDGLWRTAITDQSQIGCPSQIGPMIERMVGGGATANVTFSDPYHPTDFSDQLALASWKRVSTNGYISEPFSPIGGQEMPPGMKFTVQYGMVAISPERFEVWSKVQLTLPKFMAALAGGSSNCIAEGRGYYAYAGQ